MNNFYLIGLTGNLGSGKSTIRRLLEELGAQGIDADLIAHEVMRRGSPAWVALRRQFGNGVLNLIGEVSHKKLGAHVFGNPQALELLEQILHPAVSARIKELLRHTNSSVVVIEAIKLIEAGLHTWCDAVWVVRSKPEIQIERVARERHMRKEDAQARLSAQGALDEKLKFASVVIDNSGDLNATRVQVQRAWSAINPKSAKDKTAWLNLKPLNAVAPTVSASPPTRVEPAPIVVQAEPPEIRRAHRSDLDALAIAFAEREHLLNPLTREETLIRFGAHGYRIAVSVKKVVAFVAWDAENLVAIAREAWAENPQAAQVIPQLLAMLEDEAKQLRCEVMLVVIDRLTQPFVIEQMRGNSYQLRDLKELHPVWRQVAMDRVRSEDQIWVRLLRGELVSQPF